MSDKTKVAVGAQGTPPPAVPPDIPSRPDVPAGDGSESVSGTYSLADDGSFSTTMVNLPGFLLRFPDFLRDQQLDQLSDLLSIRTSEDPRFRDAWLGAVSFLGCGAMTAACLWLHRRAHPDNLLNLIGLAREGSSTADELREHGTNYSAFKSRALRVNSAGTNNLMVFTEPEHKTRLAANSQIIFLNLKLAELKAAVTTDWLTKLHPGVDYILPNFIKSFEEEQGRTAVEELYRRLEAAGRQDLKKNAAVIAGFTSAPNVVRGDRTFHIEVVVESGAAGRALLRFFMPEGVQPTKHPSAMDDPDAPVNFYHSEHLDITLTVGSRAEVIAASLGGALKNPLCIRTGFDLFNLFMDLPDNASNTYLSPRKMQATKRRHEDIEHLRAFYRWEGLSNEPQIAVKEDIIDCTHMDYDAVYTLTRQVKGLVEARDLGGLLKLINDCQADINGSFGARNTQVGLYLGIAHYARTKGLVVFPEEVFSPNQPLGWKVQEGVAGVANLDKRRVTSIPGLEMPLPFGVLEGSPRAQGTDIPTHFREIHDLVHPDYQLPQAWHRLDLAHRLHFIVPTLESINHLAEFLRNKGPDQIEQDDIEAIEVVTRAIAIGLRYLIPELRADENFKSYVTHLSHMVDDITATLNSNQFEKRSLASALIPFGAALQGLAQLAEYAKDPRANVRALLAKISYQLRLAKARMIQGEALMVSQLARDLLPLLSYEPPTRAQLLAPNEWGVDFVPDDYDSWPKEKKLIRPWGLPRAWVTLFGQTVIQLANLVQIAIKRDLAPNPQFILNQLIHLGKILSPLEEGIGEDFNITSLLITIRKQVDHLVRVLTINHLQELTLRFAVTHFNLALEEFRMTFIAIIDDEDSERILIKLERTYSHLRAIEETFNQAARQEGRTPTPVEQRLSGSMPKVSRAQELSEVGPSENLSPGGKGGDDSEPKARAAITVLASTPRNIEGRGRLQIGDHMPLPDAGSQLALKIVSHPSPIDTPQSPHLTIVSHDDTGGRDTGLEEINASRSNLRRGAPALANTRFMPSAVLRRNPTLTIIR